MHIRGMGDEPKKRGRKPKGPGSISFELNRVQASLVELLITKGTYGDNACDVVKYLMNEHLKVLQDKQIIPLMPEVAEIHSISRPTVEVKSTEIAKQGNA
jgi:hypothetical protein